PEKPYEDAEKTPMRADDQIAEWLVRWEEARAGNRPPPALGQLPAEPPAGAREGLRLLHGFLRLALGPRTAVPPPHRAPPPAPPPRRRRTHRATILRRSSPGAAWGRCGAAATPCWRAPWP